MSEYVKYLKQLQKIVAQELVPKTAMVDYFTVHLARYKEGPYEVEPLLWYIQSGLHSDLTLSIFRIFDRNSGRNIYHFIEYAKAHCQNIPWRYPLTNADFAIHDRLLSDVAEVIKKLRGRRHKVFAHYDTEYFYEPWRIDEAFPFSNEDAKSLVRVLQRIIADHTMALDGSASISMESFVYAASERLYETLRRGHADGPK